jgi:hypothetical protein
MLANETRSCDIKSDTRQLPTRQSTDPGPAPRAQNPTWARLFSGQIEHRLFSQITRNWRGRPLTSHETIINLISATTTTTGLTVTAQLDTDHYPTGIEISDRQMKELPIIRNAWHGDWNYTLHPTRDTPEPH